MRKLTITLGLMLAATLPAQKGPICNVAPFGKACGPALSGKVQPHARFNVVTLQVAHGPKNGLGALVFGGHTAHHKLPGGDCILMVQPLVAVAFHTDDQGRASRTISVPADVTGTALVQAVTIARHAHAIRSTNGLKIVCEKHK